jgi:hypothetical protein
VILQLGIGTGTVYLGVGVLVLALASFLAGHRYASGQEDLEHVMQPLEDVEGAEGFSMKAPSSKTGLLDTVARERKKKKALGRGMVRWHLIGSSFEEPRYIKPTRTNGGNIPEVEHEGETYIFPEDASVPSEEDGVPVVVHRKGESDPINLRSGWDLAVDSGSLSQYLTLRVTSKRPQSGLLGGLGGYDSMTLFRYGLLAIVGFAILWSVTTGGI